MIRITGIGRQRGFTLIEVLAALTIFLMASLGLLPLLLTGMQSGQRTALYSEARRLSAEAMAALQVTDFAALEAFDSLSSNNGTIIVDRAVESDTPLAGQARLTVTARWQSGGQQHRYQLQSIRSAP